MHGRRIHIGVVSEDLRYAWHVHLVEASVRPSDTTFVAHFTMPADEPTLSFRLVFNYGVLADR